MQLSALPEPNAHQEPSGARRGSAASVRLAAAIDLTGWALMMLRDSNLRTTMRATGQTHLPASGSFRYILFKRKTLFLKKAGVAERRLLDWVEVEKTAAASIPNATTLPERRRSKRAAVKAPHQSQMPQRRCPQRAGQQNSSTATRRISLLAVPLLAVALATRLRRETGKGF